MVKKKDINGFTILISSDLDYEKNVIYLNFNGDRVAILSCDEGMNQSKIELLNGYESKSVWSLNCKDFITALNLAYEELKLNDY